MNSKTTFLVISIFLITGITGCATLDRLTEKPAIFNDKTACGFILIQLQGRMKITVFDESGNFEFDSATDIITAEPEVGGKRRIAFVRSMLIETPKAMISITKVDPYWVNKVMFHQLAGEFDIVHIEKEEAPKQAPEKTKPLDSSELETTVI